MEAAVAVRDLSKRYGSVEALASVALEAFAGEIHAVVGENGAGKSTLMEALGGFVLPDSGEIVLRGARLRLGSPQASAEAGIAMVHQHFMLVPEFTVEENLALAQAHDAPVLLRASERAEKALEMGRMLGWAVDPRARVRSLSVGEQQRLEILKVLAEEARILIFDEPTAVLRPEEVEELFRVLRRLREEGKTLFLIAHKLAEVLEIADRVSVLRKGRLVASVPRSEADAGKLAFWMLGEPPPERNPSDAAPGEVVLQASNLVVKGDRGEVRVQGVSLEVRGGEVLGIGGVEGNGQAELAEALAGVRPIASGTVRAEGRAVYIPQDRHRSGLALEMTVEENLLVEGHRRSDLRRGALLDSGKVRAWAEGLCSRFEVAAPSVEVEARALSGGNQQKVVVARALDAEPAVLIAVNPTRGLDLRAAAFVRHQILEAAEAGAAVVLFSSDADELSELSSRILYMNGGRLGLDLLGSAA